MGGAAYAHIRDQYGGDVHLLRYARLLGKVSAAAFAAALAIAQERKPSYLAMTFQPASSTSPASSSTPILPSTA